MSYKFKVEAREEFGTGASRRMRNAGKIPAIVYGGEKEAVSIKLDHDKVIHAIENKDFFDSEITLICGDKEETVKLKALQRHPYKRKIIHADFVRV